MSSSRLPISFFSLVIFTFIIIFFSLSLTSFSIEAKDAPKHNRIVDGYQQVDPDQIENLPDLQDDDDVQLEANCAACMSSLSLLKQAIDKVKIRFRHERHKLKESHLIEATDDLCKGVAMRMGHYMPDKSNLERPLRFVHEDLVNTKNGSTLLKGGETERIFDRECNAFLEDAQETLYEVMTTNKHIQYCKVCVKRDKMFVKKKKEVERALKRKKNKKNKKKKEEKDSGDL